MYKKGVLNFVYLLNIIINILCKIYNKYNSLRVIIKVLLNILVNKFYLLFNFIKQVPFSRDVNST